MLTYSFGNCTEECLSHLSLVQRGDMTEEEFIQYIKSERGKTSQTKANETKVIPLAFIF